MPANKTRFPLDPNGTPGILRDMVPDGTFRAVTPSDTVEIKGGLARSLYVGTGGNLVAVNENDQAVTFANVADGTVLPIATKRVNATNTTASDIVAL